MMDSLIVKLFATALALSQITTRPDDIKPQFSPETDRQQVAELLTAGCRHMLQTFEVEDINFDDLIETAMEDPEAVTADIKILNGLQVKDLVTAYKEYCKGEKVAQSPVDLAAVIAYYNSAAADLPDAAAFRTTPMPQASVLLDGAGKPFTQMVSGDNRRIRVRLAQIPDHVQKAFIAAEDKRFLTHRGIDERGLIRAFVSNFRQDGRPQGGSTITQQIVKNMLVGDDLTYERKIREMIVAARLEREVGKNDILETYLNYIYLGRASWGVEMAAQSWFGKSVKALTLGEGALLAALAKGPNYYDPERRWTRAYERLAYVLDRMREDGYITAEQAAAALAQKPRLVPFTSPRPPDGFYFIDEVAREARAAGGVADLTAEPYRIRSTLNPKLQTATEAALQEGLARYELNSGRYKFTGPELSLATAVAAQEAGESGAPAWREALKKARLPLYDVHWTPAIVVQKATAKKRTTVSVGLEDGRVVPLRTLSSAIGAKLSLYDVVYVQLVEPKGKQAYAALRVRPEVQGAAVVIENKTGRVLALAGGFSYPLSQLNRATQAERQPGSTIKPLTYLAALGHGLQPNTLVLDAPVTLPPISNDRAAQSWTPKNYDGSASGAITLRQALEHSKNFVTARLLEGGIRQMPEESLDEVCALAKELALYQSCVRYYPFVLGAQPVRLLDMAAFYATIANEGFRPTPYLVESIEKDGRPVFRRLPSKPIEVGRVDRVAFYQMKSFLQGVMQRGTAASLKQLAPFVAGKTGTTDGENDAWFVGFTNEVTVAVWVGYDNAEGRRTLGGGFTGGKVALPIFGSIVQAVWRDVTPRTALNGPSPEVKQAIATLPIDLRTGTQLDYAAAGAFKEVFRLDGGYLADTQYRLVSRSDVYRVARSPDPDDDADAELGYYRRSAPAPRPPTYSNGWGGWSTPWGSRPAPRYGYGYGNGYGSGYSNRGYGYGQEPRYENRPGSFGFPAPRRVDPEYPRGGFFGQGWMR